MTEPTTGTAYALVIPPRPLGLAIGAGISTARGWIHLILGAVLVLVGVVLLTGATWARVAGVIALGLSIVANFLWISLLPVVVADGDRPRSRWNLGTRGVEARPRLNSVGADRGHTGLA